MEEDRWPSVAVMGAGAVGCYFGGMLARAGAPVTLIGRPSHVEAVTRVGLLLESAQFSQHVPAAASSDVAAARGAEVVLFSVKTLDTEKAARMLAPHLAEGAAVVSLQNGVDNVERIHLSTGIEAIPAAVYIAAEMTAPGSVRHHARGDLVIGDLPGLGPIDGARERQLASIAALFVRAGVPCRISDNIQTDLWTKLVMNCAYNAISALSRARYGQIAGNTWTRDVVRQVVEETVAVARAAGVRGMDDGLVEAAWVLGETMSGATSSTAQDIARSKLTEIDSLNGYVSRRGAELGVATPVNQTLHALVKLLEEG